MTDDPPDDPPAAAIDQLQELGLSAYAARTFVALVSLGSGTAADVSEIATVPRTRVYDAVDELQALGLVAVRQGSPKEFWPVSADTTTRTFRRRLDRRLSALDAALEALEPVERREEQRGVWTVDGTAAVTDRVVEFIEGAEEEVVYMTVAELLTDPILAALTAAAERGVQVTLGGVSPEVRDRIEASIPEAEVFESLWVWSDTPAGRLLMVDDTRTLVSVLVNGPAAPPTAPRSETAIWGAGETNSLVVVLRAIFTWRLQNPDATS